jgi:DNA-binding transcriptional LysR family regulator
VAKALLGQVSEMDLRLLRVFRAVVEAGGFAAAELALDIGRSTISRHIKDLETRLGLRLCRRGRGGFALTPEGEHIYQATLRVLGAIADLKSEVHTLHQRLTGSLQLALFDKTVTNPECRIAEAIGLLDERAPEVVVEIRVLPLNEIERGVLDGHVHVGVIPTHRRSEACDYVPLFGERMLLYCGEGHPLFARAAAGHARDGRAQGRPLREEGEISDEEVRAQPFAGLGFHSDNMERGHAFGLERRATAYDQEGVATLILSGAYLGFLPDHYAASFVAQGRMRAVSPATFTYTCHFEAIVRHAAQRARLAQTFVELLVEAHRRG